MYRFMPTASGKLHMGHFGNLCLIEYIAKNSPKYYVIDDHQLRDWNLYEKEYTQKEIDDNIRSIRHIMDFYFPSFINAGNFLDNKYEQARCLEFCRLHDNIKDFKWQNHRYAILKEDYHELRAVNISRFYYKPSHYFDVLKCFYKYDLSKYPLRTLNGFGEWNPFFSHEVVDKVLNSKYQIVDWTLYHPYSYHVDDHTNSFELFSYWKNIIKKQNMEIQVHPVITDFNGNSLSKSRLEEDNPYTLGSNISYELEIKRIKYSYGIPIETSFEYTKELIAKQLLEADIEKPFKLRKI